MCIDNFIIIVYCTVCEYFKKHNEFKSVRKRGFKPRLSDEEVITIEIVGEFLQIDTDKGIWQYFGQQWKDWFPNIGSRTTFVRQSANLWKIKELIQSDLAENLGSISDSVHSVDGFPIQLCNFRRAKFSRLFKGFASYGFCASKNITYYGFKGHLVINFDGVITSWTISPANSSERECVYELVKKIHGLLLGDKGYISPELEEELRRIGINLQTPKRKNMEDKRDPQFVSMLMNVRRLIETVIGQLSERFHIEKIRARDMWHLTNRINRKILSHTVACFICRRFGVKTLQFEKLIVS
ncbi:MAG: IS982 family transposase [SAR324 cluster bacterium]|nr:IS982 family transposase [SAR324 cluster bacterium]